MTRQLTGPNHTRLSTARVPLVAVIVAAFTLSAGAQTRIEPDKNRYSPQQDVQLGRQAADEVRAKMPILDDERTESFVEAIGDRLVAEIPDYLTSRNSATASTSST
jgi:predicted Zn-dependent protease